MSQEASTAIKDKFKPAIDAALQSWNQGNRAQAIEQLESVIKKTPNADVYSYLGLFYLQTKHTENAFEAFQEAITLEPTASNYNNLGHFFYQTGRETDAEENLQKAISLDPNLSIAHYNLGNVLLRSNTVKEAFEYFKIAARLNPKHADTFFRLGAIFHSQADYTNALKCYERATALNPKHVQALRHFGNIHRLQNHYGEAKKAYDQCLKLTPDDRELFAELVHTKHHLCDWENYDTDIAKLHADAAAAINSNQATPVHPFFSLNLPWTPEFQLQIANTHANKIKSTINPNDIFSSYASQADQPIIRIGYVSNDFYEHATSQLIYHLFKLHNRERFHVSAYSHGPNKDSVMRKNMIQTCDQFVDINQLSDVDAAKQIHDDNIDILIDLKGYTSDNRLSLFAYRPAPIQISYLGYPGTTGADFIDYIISDDLLTEPKDQIYYSETLLPLQRCYQINRVDHFVHPEKPTREAYGLPKDAFVFASFNGPYKITPTIYQCWMDILKQTEQSVLWIMVTGDDVKNNLQLIATQQGIDTSRLIFTKQEAQPYHLARMTLADIMLDTYPINGHTTTSDALWSGLPVLTLKGKTFASRVAASILNEVYFDELITDDLNAYKEKAIELTKNPQLIMSFKSKLGKHRNSSLFDSKDFVRHFERALTTAFQQPKKKP